MVEREWRMRRTGEREGRKDEKGWKMKKRGG
jgi:hypothetical protein